MLLKNSLLLLLRKLEKPLWVKTFEGDLSLLKYTKLGTREKNTVKKIIFFDTKRGKKSMIV